MALLFDISISVEFWRRMYPISKTPSGACNEVPLECANTARDIMRLLPKRFDNDFLASVGGKVQVYVRDKSLRRSSAHHIAHVWSAPIPKGSFYRLTDDVYVASPEFIFLAAAPLLTEYQLIALGYELCGLYSFDCTAERGMRKREIPLTSIDCIRNYLDGARNCPGHRKAMQALRHVMERSASPMETFDVMAIFGKYRLGGYGLERPVLNLEITLNSRAAHIAKKSTCIPDICLPRIMLDIEHYGAFDHEAGSSRVSDRARVNALKEMGFHVIELTSDQVNDLNTLEYIVLRVAKMLGKRIPKDKLGSTPERLELRREIFAWNRSYGRLR